MTFPGIQGYAAEAEALLRQYESTSFAEVYRGMTDLVPAAPGRVLDIGAGTGRDAAALAGLGHAVVAVEPTAALRLGGMRLHPSPRIDWLEDGLPDLERVSGTFDLALLTAVWMHLDAAQRSVAMPWVAGLLAPGGTLLMTLRHGPVPAGRRMDDVSGEETIALAAASALVPVRRLEAQDGLFGRRDVSWTKLAFRRP